MQHPIQHPMQRGIMSVPLTPHLLQQQQIQQMQQMQQQQMQQQQMQQMQQQQQIQQMQQLMQQQQMQQKMQQQIPQYTPHQIPQHGLQQIPQQIIQQQHAQHIPQQTSLLPTPPTATSISLRILLFFSLPPLFLPSAFVLHPVSNHSLFAIASFIFYLFSCFRS